MISANELHGTPSLKEQEYLLGWQRARAELDNFKKRLAKEEGHRQDLLKRNVLEPLLEVADNFAAIAQHVPPERAEDTWTEGVLHVGRQLEGVLSQFDVKKVGQVGEPFNPAIHEAAGEGNEEQGSGQVVEVVRAGYQVGDIVIRPARVKVGV